MNLMLGILIYRFENETCIQVESISNDAIQPFICIH